MDPVFLASMNGPQYSQDPNAAHYHSPNAFSTPHIGMHYGQTSSDSMWHGELGKGNDLASPVSLSQDHQNGPMDIVNELIQDEAATAQLRHVARGSNHILNGQACEGRKEVRSRSKKGLKTDVGVSDIAEDGPVAGKKRKKIISTRKGKKAKKACCDADPGKMTKKTLEATRLSDFTSRAKAGESNESVKAKTNIHEPLAKHQHGRIQLLDRAEEKAKSESNFSLYDNISRLTRKVVLVEETLKKFEEDAQARLVEERLKKLEEGAQAALVEERLKKDREDDQAFRNEQRAADARILSILQCLKSAISPGRK